MPDADVKLAVGEGTVIVEGGEFVMTNVGPSPLPKIPIGTHPQPITGFSTVTSKDAVAAGSIFEPQFPFQCTVDCHCAPIRAFGTAPFPSLSVAKSGPNSPKLRTLPYGAGPPLRSLSTCPLTTAPPWAKATGQMVCCPGHRFITSLVSIVSAVGLGAGQPGRKKGASAV